MNGDSANPNDATIGVMNCLLPLCGQQNNVSPIINIKNNEAKAEGSLAERVPKLSQISFSVMSKKNPLANISVEAYQNGIFH